MLLRGCRKVDGARWHRRSVSTHAMGHNALKYGRKTGNQRCNTYLLNQSDALRIKDVKHKAEKVHLLEMSDGAYNLDQQQSNERMQDMDIAIMQALTSTNSPKLIKASFLVSVKEKKLNTVVNNKRVATSNRPLTYELRDSIGYRGARILHDVIEKLFHALFRKRQREVNPVKILEIRFDCPTNCPLPVVSCLVYSLHSSSIL